MSSSGKGQSFIRSADQLSEAALCAAGRPRWRRTGDRRGVVNFDFEITLLTVSAVDGVHFCAPVGHRQEDGDYRESRQPQQMSDPPSSVPVPSPARWCWRWEVMVCLAWSCSYAATR